MATVDQVDSAFSAWAPPASGIAAEDEQYVGRHRKPGAGRIFSLHGLFYYARHRAR